MAISPETIKVGRGPWGVTANEATEKIYVANWQSGSVSVIDGEKNVVTKTITGMPNIIQLSVNQRTNIVYATGSQSHKTFVIDGNKDEIVKIFDFDSTASAVNSITNKVYLGKGEVSLSEGSISVVNGSSYEIIGDVPDIGKIESIAVNEKTNMVYATLDEYRNGNNHGKGLVYVIDGSTDQVTSILQVERQPRQILINPITDKAYIGNANPPFLTVIDLKTNKMNSLESKDAYAASSIAINPKTNRIYALANSNLVVIDGDRDRIINQTKIDTGYGDMYGIAINSNSNLIYVTNYELDSVSVIDGTTNKVILSVVSYSREINEGLAIALVSIGASVPYLALRKKMMFSLHNQVSSRWRFPRLPLSVVSIFGLGLTAFAMYALGYITYSFVHASAEGDVNVIGIVVAFYGGVYLILLTITSIVGSVTLLLKNSKTGFYVSLSFLILWSLGLVFFAYTWISNPRAEQYYFDILLPLLVLTSVMYSLLILGKKALIVKRN